MTNEQGSYLTLEPLFNPNSVAILGASENKRKLGYMQVKALLDGGFKGEIYPINPRSQVIEGLECFQTLSDVPKQIDLAIFCVGADKVKVCLEECAENKVKAAIIFASGFSEIGEEGLKEQQLIREIAKESGIRLIGPNCVGLVNTTNGLIGTFSAGLTNVPLNVQRDVGFVTQSGAFGVLTYIAAAQNGLSFNYFVSVGNEVETEFSDVVEYMIHDPKTSVISGYLEGEKSPGKLRQLAKQALIRNKPIIVMKAGRSSAGIRAAASHTGSLAGSDKIYNSFFKQTGIIRADDYDDIISFAKLFLSKKLPTGRNTVIITSSGGRGINEADRCEAHGLKINSLNRLAKTEIQRHIPTYASAINPIDLTAAAAVSNPELYLEPLKVLAKDPDTDIIIFTEFPMNWTSDNPLFKEFIEICRGTDKFILVSTFPLEGMSIPKTAVELEKNGIPVIPGNLNPIKALAKLVDYSEKYQKNKHNENLSIPKLQEKKVLKSLLQAGTTLSEFQSSDILDLYGIPTTKRAIATTENEATHHAANIGYPVALKIDSPDIPHKTEADAIRLHLNDDQEVRNAFKEIHLNVSDYKQNARINGVSVQEMLPEGVEVIVGVTNNPVFGPVIMFGLGGVFVEVFQDISFRLAPLTKNDAIEMIEEIKGYSLLKGPRGKPPVNIDAIVDVLLKVSALVTDYGDCIEELDINPLIVNEKGIVAADAMIVTRDSIDQTTAVGR
ncbi:acetate--CoA ligase family protein [Virgibacillus necropolis]|uniref:Acetyl-CoA synthetase n=1 Tax=Virgibacillus necropolis TaxID=163877 RepID=A0A221MEU8_9BACI|nr:acetate--CoA ligase family protein [Virgibacillus necropolis]ASN06161.1 acetyl-CoA synthetase [Virgibacillus necropolis]